MGYPTSLFIPRVKTNVPGVAYTPEKTNVVFSEDVSFLDQEIISIEKELLGAALYEDFLSAGSGIQNLTYGPPTVQNWALFICSGKCFDELLDEENGIARFSVDSSISSPLMFELTQNQKHFYIPRKNFIFKTRVRCSIFAENFTYFIGLANFSSVNLFGFTCDPLTDFRFNVIVRDIDGSYRIATTYNFIPDTFFDLQINCVFNSQTRLYTLYFYINQALVAQTDTHFDPDLGMGFLNRISSNQTPTTFPSFDIDFLKITQTR
jgi:hypothetical protein